MSATVRPPTRCRPPDVGYVEQFQQMRCAADLMRVLQPVRHPRRQIARAMALRRRVRDLVLRQPHKDWWVVDLCAGSGLAAALVAFTLPRVQVLAVDRVIPWRPWHRVHRMQWLAADLLMGDFALQGRIPASATVVLMASHAVGAKAHQMVDLFLKSPVEHLVMRPADAGAGLQVPGFAQGRLSPYEAWCWHLALRVGGNVQVDRRCAGPHGAILTASKPLSGRYVALDDPLHLRVSGLYEAARKVSGDAALQQAVGDVAALLEAG